MWSFNITSCNHFSGDHGDSWQKSSIYIQSDIQALFLEGRRGSDYHGDIAVDDLELSSGRCAGMK